MTQSFPRPGTAAPQQRSQQQQDIEAERVATVQTEVLRRLDKLEAEHDRMGEHAQVTESRLADNAARIEGIQELEKWQLALLGAILAEVIGRYIIVIFQRRTPGP